MAFPLCLCSPFLNGKNNLAVLHKDDWWKSSLDLQLCWWELIQLLSNTLKITAFMLVKVLVYSSDAQYTWVHDFTTQIRGFAFSPANLTLIDGYMHQPVHTVHQYLSFISTLTGILSRDKSPQNGQILVPFFFFSDKSYKMKWTSPGKFRYFIIFNNLFLLLFSILNFSFYFHLGLPK